MWLKGREENGASYHLYHTLNLKHFGFRRFLALLYSLLLHLN